MKVIFLDIDGVLNTHRFFEEQLENHNGIIPEGVDFQTNFDPLAMKNLQEIVELTDAKIVVSSTWRTSRDMPYNSSYRRLWEAIIKNLTSVGIHREIIDITPYLKGDVTRGQEIKEWLKDKNNIESFVIIDDDRDMDELTETNLAWCKGLDGINEEVKNRAIEILNMAS